MHHSITNEDIIQMRVQGKRESIDILADEVIRLRGYIEALESIKPPAPVIYQAPVVETTKTPYPFGITTTWSPPKSGYYMSYNHGSNQEGLAGAI